MKVSKCNKCSSVRKAGAGKLETIWRHSYLQGDSRPFIFSQRPESKNDWQSNFVAESLPIEDAFDFATKDIGSSAFSARTPGARSLKKVAIKEKERERERDGKKLDSNELVVFIKLLYNAGERLFLSGRILHWQISVLKVESDKDIPSKRANWRP